MARARSDASTTVMAPRDVAKRLGLSVSRVTQLDLIGRLPAMRDSSGRRFYDAELVERFAREREAAAAQPHGVVSPPAA